MVLSTTRPRTLAEGGYMDCGAPQPRWNRDSGRSPNDIYTVRYVSCLWYGIRIHY